MNMMHVLLVLLGALGSFSAMAFAFMTDANPVVGLVAYLIGFSVGSMAMWVEIRKERWS